METLIAYAIIIGSLTAVAFKIKQVILSSSSGSSGCGGGCSGCGSQKSCSSMSEGIKNMKV